MDHKLAGLHRHRWIHPRILVGRWRPGAEGDPHGGGDEGLRPEVVERRLKPEQGRGYLVGVTAWWEKGAMVQ